MPRLLPVALVLLLWAGVAHAQYEVRHPMRLMLFEGGDHGLSEYRAEVFRAVLAWLDRYVRDGGALPNLEPHGR